MTTEQRIRQLELLKPAKNRTHWLQTLRMYFKGDEYSDAELWRIAKQYESPLDVILQLYDIQKVNERGKTNER